MLRINKQFDVFEYFADIYTLIGAGVTLQVRPEGYTTGGIRRLRRSTGRHSR